MQSLASFIMRGRMQAVLVSVLFAGLSLILPPLMYLSGGAVALVTLRLGATQGLSVMALSTLALVLLAQLSMGSPLAGIVLALIMWLPVWALSLVLRQTVSLGATVGAATLLAATLVLAGHMILPEPAVWWQGKLEGLLGPIFDQLGVHEQPGLREAMQQVAKFMTGFVAFAVIMNTLCSVLLARWWQAVLYNPGGFRREFHELRLPRALSIVAGLAVAVNYLANGPAAEFAGNLAVVFAGVYLMQGLAICHDVVAKKGLHVAWLLGVYVLTLLLPQMMLLLTLLGLIDTWANFRGHVSSSPDQGGEKPN
ncbi:MAG: DUF2232 domain-containing protein [Pseudomonadota bacterium]